MSCKILLQFKFRIMVNSGKMTLKLQIAANPRNWKEHSDMIAFFSRQKGCTQMETPFGYASEHVHTSTDMY